MLRDMPSWFRRIKPVDFRAEISRMPTADLRALTERPLPPHHMSMVRVELDWRKILRSP
jgi:hypothetical protein